MHSTDYLTSLETNSRFDALIVGTGGPGRGSDAAAAVVLAGGRVMARVDGGEAADRIGKIAARPVILVDAEGLGEDWLAAMLPQVDELVATLDLPIIAGVDAAQIDVAAAGLRLSRHQILCAPNQSDWVVALVTSRDPDRLVLHDRIGEGDAQRLAKMDADVARITNVLASLSHREGQPQPSVVADRKLGFVVDTDTPPDISPADVRQIVRARRMRDRHFGEGMFEDPAWDMMLDLYAAHLERGQVSVSSLCIAAAVAPTTALRWIARLTEAGLFDRRPDPFDRRRAFMSLSDSGLAAMHRYVVTVRSMGLPLV